ncbi:Spo0E family sporulation regulatory protein-aspartic acid phosphatase [Syntrophomonas erecta]
MIAKPVDDDQKQRLGILIHRIEQERAQLVELGTQKGFLHEEVLSKSRLVDDMVNEYYALLSNS